MDEEASAMTYEKIYAPQKQQLLYLLNISSPQDAQYVLNSNILRIRWK